MCNPDDVDDSLGVDRIHLMKIDVEGFTDLVLSKSRMLFRRLITSSSSSRTRYNFAHRISSEAEILDHSEKLF